MLANHTQLLNAYLCMLNGNGMGNGKWFGDGTERKCCLFCLLLYMGTTVDQEIFVVKKFFWVFVFFIILYIYMVQDSLIAGGFSCPWHEGRAIANIEYYTHIHIHMTQLCSFSFSMGGENNWKDRALVLTQS